MNGYQIRRKPMQVSIESICKAHGKLAEFETAIKDGGEFHLRLEQDGYMPLVIEHIGGGEVSIAHYFTQNGDAMRDPEIVFQVVSGKHPLNWRPVEITQDPMGIYRRRTITTAHQFDASVAGLVRIWAHNLKHQGWDEARETR